MLLAMIAVLLAMIAVLLAREITSLLIGEAAVPEQVNKIHSAILATPGIEQVIHLRTLHLAPDDLLVAAQIGVAAKADAEDVAVTTDARRGADPAALPTARIIYLEPDLYRADAATRPGQPLATGANREG